MEDNLSLSSNNDLFAFGIGYNNAFGISLYNGNISSTSWKSKADNQKRSYIYSYDAMNRLNTATFTQDTAQGSPWPAGFNRYDEKGITYDKNGNILSLERRGLTATSGTTDTFGVMDKLTYTYGQYTNRLDRVKDDAPASAITGFTDGVDIALEYSYDANGNMVKDLNKKIGTTSTNGITYNYLNLPLTITIDDASTLKKIEYVYDAVGTKLKKTVTTGTSTETTEYDSGFVFYKIGSTANKLQFFPTPEGYATQENNAADIKYTYQYKDHLGNVRLSYTDTNGNNVIAATEVIEESNYYPFGLQHKGYNNIVSIQNGNSTAQKWKYNDTEYNDAFSMNMYEMPLRSYDPALARWTTIDPVTHYSTSTYNGYDNNPVFWADPSGGNVIQNDNGWEFNGADAGAAFNAYLGMMDTGQGQFQLQGEYFDMTGIFELPEVGVSGSGGTLNGLGEIVQNHTYANSPFYQNVNSNTTSSVGQPGTWESMIPVWGSGRAAVDHFQNGNWVEGSLYTALAVSDLFLVKAVFTAAAKGAITMAGKHALKQAVKNPNLTAGEAYRLSVTSSPGVASMMKGKGVDRAFRDYAKRNWILNPAQKIGILGINPTNRGADMIGKGLLKGTWWDVTTMGAWPAHQAKYGAGGIGLIY